MATLAPRTDPLNARVRGGSHIDFKTATTGVAAKAMRNEISHLVSTCEDHAKKVSPHIPYTCLSFFNPQQAFDTEMQSFFYLFTRYLSERAKSVDLYVIIFSGCEVDHFKLNCLLSVTGIASSPLPRTKLYPMTPYLRLMITATSTSSLY